jgi:hypothetical protein
VVPVLLKSRTLGQYRGCALLEISFGAEGVALDGDLNGGLEVMTVKWLQDETRRDRSL